MNLEPAAATAVEIEAARISTLPDDIAPRDPVIELPACAGADDDGALHPYCLHGYDGLVGPPWPWESRRDGIAGIRSRPPPLSP